MTHRAQNLEGRYDAAVRCCQQYEKYIAGLSKMREEQRPTTDEEDTLNISSIERCIERSDAKNRVGRSLLGRGWYLNERLRASE